MLEKIQNCFFQRNVEIISFTVGYQSLPETGDQTWSHDLIEGSYSYYYYLHSIFARRYHKILVTQFNLEKNEILI